MSSTNTKSNVAVGKPKVTGAVFRADSGTTLPTSAKTNLASAFKGMGYVSDDGVVNSNSPESTEIKAWGGDVVAVPYTGKPDTIKFKMIEVLNEHVQKAVYGSANVTTVGNETKITVNSKEAEEGVWVVDTILGSYIKRIIYPNGKITEVGDIVYKDDEVVGYEVTITGMPDSDGNSHYEYIAPITGATGGTGATQ